MCLQVASKSGGLRGQSDYPTLDDLSFICAPQTGPALRSPSGGARVFTQQEKACILSRQVGKGVRTDFTNQEKAEGVANMLNHLLCDIGFDKLNRCLTKQTNIPDSTGDHVIALGSKGCHFITPFSLINDVVQLTTGKLLTYGQDRHGVPAFVVA